MDRDDMAGVDITSGSEMNTKVAQAAGEPGVGDEIGALRAVMARLLLEEDDLTKLVTGVSRLTAAIVQAARLQRLIEGPPADPLSEAINLAWVEFERQQAAPAREETVR